MRKSFTYLWIIVESLMFGFLRQFHFCWIVFVSVSGCVSWIFCFLFWCHFVAKQKKKKIVKIIFREWLYRSTEREKLFNEKRMHLKMRQPDRDGGEQDIVLLTGHCRFNAKISNVHITFDCHFRNGFHQFVHEFLYLFYECQIDDAMICFHSNCLSLSLPLNIWWHVN